MATRARPYDVVLFDLLTALLDSPTLWNDIAGSVDAGNRWRGNYLRLTYATGVYRPYGELAAEAAVEAGLPASLAERLEARFGELQPWPEVRSTLRALAEAGLTLGVVTNCSERLGRVAADCVGVPLDLVVTAEAAGCYKPQPRPYLMAVEASGAPVARCLFVAGSAYDLVGTAAVGLDTYWHDRLGMAPVPGAPAPLRREASLSPLAPLLLGDGLA